MFVAGAAFERHSYGLPVAMVAVSLLAGHVCIMLFFVLDGCCQLPPRPEAPAGPKRGPGKAAAAVPRVQQVHAS